MSDLRARLRELDEEFEGLRASFREARKAAEPRRTDMTAEVFAPLKSKNPVRTRPEDYEAATREIVKRIQDDCLLLIPADFQRPGQGVRVHDPRPARALSEAEAHLREAEQARHDYAAEHADDLAAEEREREFTEIEEAIVDRDPAALRTALRLGVS